MNVRAKFRCSRVTHFETHSLTDVVAEIVLAPVYGTTDRPDNAEWSKYTPQGEIKMTKNAAATVDQRRLEKLAEFGPLANGTHNDSKAAVCIMEAVAFVAGEAWSDHPECACPVIGALCLAG